MSEANKNKRVVVAMSGGVDSSVAAALLKEQGYEVIGVSLKLWDYDEEERQQTGKTCCSLDDIADAKDVCDDLGIPFYAFNYKPAFQKAVIETFVNEYHRGRTPNPCILCNKHIKFDVLLEEAKKLGADYLATGHYARVIQKDNEQFALLKGRDSDKDQSYVLFHLSQDDLKRILFPLGDFTKAEIREIAERYNLVTKDKRESMEICFIPNNDHAAFIAKNYPNKKARPGRFVDRNGKDLGAHRGIDAYTVGQRRGLGVSTGERLYVAQIKPDTNEVVLDHEDTLFFGGVLGERFHFLREPSKKELGVKLRYQKDEVPAEIVSFDQKTSQIELRFSEKARAVTPGQAMVLYEDTEVIGGGWISNSIR